MKIKRFYIPIYLCCMYCFLEAMLSTELTLIISSSFISIIKYLVALVSIAYCVKDLLLIKLRKSIIIYSILLLISFLITFFSHSLQLFVFLVLCFNLRKYNLKTIIKHLYFTLLTVITITVFLYLIKVYPDLDFDRNGTERKALGFLTPTLPQSLLLFLLLTDIYLYGRKISYLKLLVYFIVGLVMYKFTVGRTGFFLFVFTLILMVLIKLFKRKTIIKIISNKFIQFIVLLLPLFMLIGSIILTLMFNANNEFAVKLNYVLSTRLVLQRNAFLEQPIKLFGSNIYWFNSENIYIGVDNSYLYHLFNYGIFAFFGIILFYVLILKDGLKKKDYILIFVVAIILLDSLFEPYMIDFKYNYITFYLVVLFEHFEDRILFVNRNINRVGDAI